MGLFQMPSLADPHNMFHALFTNIYPINDPNVGRYTIHGAYGIFLHPPPMLLQGYFKAHGEPLFSSHMLDLSEARRARKLALLLWS